MSIEEIEERLRDLSAALPMLRDDQFRRDVLNDIDNLLDQLLTLQNAEVLDAELQ